MNGCKLKKISINHQISFTSCFFHFKFKEIQKKKEHEKDSQPMSCKGQGQGQPAGAGEPFTDSAAKRRSDDTLQ